MPRPWLGIAIVSGVLLAAMLLWTAAVAQPVSRERCGARAAITNHLFLQYGEKPVAVAKVNDVTILEIHVSANGTWSLLFSFENGLACFIANGTEWRDTRAKGEAS